MNSRFGAICDISERESVESMFEYEERGVASFFGELVFNEKVQKERLLPETFDKLQRTIHRGDELDPSLADEVAEAMKNWAIERGATHYCHWFQPLTDLTAEKHDSFFMPTENGGALPVFSGSELIRGEPDASSFPSGGLRSTFEARGYTAWDPSSPAFLNGQVLVIPTMFVSWTGEALGKKTPLLRSMDVLSTHALRILRLFGDMSTQRVVTTVGAEQEYFLIDKRFYNLRPDLLATGRTLFGAKPPKGQELEDQYLGTIPERVLAVMSDLEHELMRLGLPVKTRHNEVAPGQYELALTYQTANRAADHQMIVMEMLRKVADRHGMACLLHEKPFAAINGSGKHNNWAIATDDGRNLIEPGDTPHDNAQFLLFTSAVLRAVHKYAPLLRLSISNAGNDHRLGAHEAPPGIISVFLGTQLAQIFERLRGGNPDAPQKSENLAIGVSVLPHLPRHSSDRNRTSPFAFTGNKFEFRAVGSTENIARPNTILNTIVAESVDWVATRLEKDVESGKKLNEAVQELLSEMATEFAPIIFEGDNYDQSWFREAEKRGLPNIKDTVEAAAHYTSEAAVDLFEKYNVLSRRELESREETTLWNYVRKLTIEAKTASMMAHTLILPAALKYQRDVGEAVKFQEESDLLDTIIEKIATFREALKNLDTVLSEIPTETVQERAVYMRDEVLTTMNRLRSAADHLELLVDDALWPLPKYREMLFIR